VNLKTRTPGDPAPGLCNCARGLILVFDAVEAEVRLGEKPSNRVEVRWATVPDRNAARGGTIDRMARPLLARKPLFGGASQASDQLGRRTAHLRVKVGDQQFFFFNETFADLLVQPPPFVSALNPDDPRIAHLSNPARETFSNQRPYDTTCRALVEIHLPCELLKGGRTEVHESRQREALRNRYVLATDALSVSGLVNL
jgi:hypothetical protein